LSSCSRELEEAEQEEVVRILLVDDHATIRDALSSTFEGEEDFEVVGQAGLGMRKTEITGEPMRPWNPHFYAIFAQVHNTL
jgi:hypothetical protein